MKNIASVLNAMDHLSEYSYGKYLSFVHDRTVFTPRALKWLDAMRDVLKVQFNLKSFDAYSTSYHNNSFRQISLNGYGLERCMDIVIGEDIDISGDTYHVTDADPQLTLNIRGEKGGARLLAEPVFGMTGNTSLFVVTEHTIYKCSPDFKNVVWPLLEALGAGYTGYVTAVHPLYLNTKDYRRFCRTMLPALQGLMMFLWKIWTFQNTCRRRL